MNANGAVCQFEGPDGVSGLFMGDVGDESAHNAESWLLEQHENDDSDIHLSSDILYIGHHGSNKSTGERFLAAVDPEHVVISSGLDNNYTSENQYDGHPHDATLERLHDQDVSVHWTAVHGTTNTTVEDGEVQMDHDSAIETTAAADLAVLKYHARANEVDQDQLAEIEEIAREDLPEVTPEWATGADLVTDLTAEERTAKIDDLHALEVEHRRLTQKKERLERTCEQRIEEKAALEQQMGGIERITNAISGIRGARAKETESNADTKQDDTASAETTPDSEAHTDRDTQATERNQPDERDTTADNQWEDLDATIAAYEQRNAALKTDVETLTEERATLDDTIDTLEQQTAGLFGRISEAVTALTNDKQPVEIRRERFNDTASELTDDDPTASTTESNRTADSSSRLGVAEASETRDRDCATENTESTTAENHPGSEKERPETNRKRDFSM